MNLVIRCWLLGLLLGLAGWADIVTFKDGSTLKGTVLGVSGGKIKIKTTIAGTVDADLSQVVEISSEETLNVALKDGSIIKGHIVTTAEGETQIRNEYGHMTVKPEGIDAAWGPGDPNPFQRHWTYEAYFNLNGRTGNSEQYTLSGGAKALLKGADDNFLMYVRGQRSETDGVLSSKEVIGGLDFERLFGDSKRHSWYVRTEVEYDAVEELDLRTTVAGGYGYYWLRESDHELRTRIGLFYRHESYKYRDDESTVGVDLGLHHMKKLGDWGRVVTDLTMTPSLEDVSDYRIWHESWLEFPLKSPNMKVRLGIANEYNSRTGDDVKHHDLYYFASLVFNWGER